VRKKGVGPLRSRKGCLSPGGKVRLLEGSLMLWWGFLLVHKGKKEKRATGKKVRDEQARDERRNTGQGIGQKRRQRAVFK